MTRPRVILGVSGGIAAYKACELLRLLTESGHRVRVVPTAAALRFVGAPTWAALSGEPVTADPFADVHEVPHVALGRDCDLLIVAPATADLLARASHGAADDLLTNTLLTTRAPVLFAPAMHTEMWQHPATVDNVDALRRRGAIVLDPAVGRLTGADTGPGRLPDPAEIFAVARRLLRRGHRPPDLTGRRVLVTAGGTREPIDPVRFLGNHSSGRQGYALARAAIARGASVELISANVTLPDPAGARVSQVGTTEQLRSATLEAAEHADIIVLAAAPADFRPATVATEKIKKVPGTAAPVLHLVTNPDIAAELGAGKRPGQVIVAFAAEATAETAAALAHAADKLTRKRADLIVVNEVGPDKVFGQATNAVTVLGPEGVIATVAEADKDEVADAIWDVVAARPV